MRGKQNKITIHDIARKAGVSAGTVDRVIHNRSGVSENTRKEVLKFIKVLDYQPDVLARALASKKGIRIAAIYPGLKSGKPFWSLPEIGMEKAVAEYRHFGMQLEKYPFELSEPSSFMKQAQKLFKTTSDGIILAPGLMKEAEWFTKKCRSLNIPLIYINSRLDSGDFLSYIGQDSYASGKVAAGLMNEVISKEKVIAIFNIEQHPETQVHINEREMGFIDHSINEYGKSEKSILIFNITNANARSVNADLEKIFSSNSIAGVYITNSRAYLIAQWLEIHKKYCPVVIGYDLIVENRKMLNKGIISFLISQKPEEQGYKSITTLFNFLVLGRKAEQNQLLPIDILTIENIPYYTI